MGLAVADTKGQAAEGAVWVKMNVKEKSTGVPDAWGRRGSRRRGGARERHEAVQHQVPDMGLALPKRRPTKKTRWIEVPEFPIWGSNTRAEKSIREADFPIWGSNP